MQAHNATTNQTAAPHAEATIGAVIVAAGMSSRMGDFKPMMGIGAHFHRPTHRRHAASGRRSSHRRRHWI